jgi:hypothetical protein
VKSEGDVILNWSTATETNNLGFEIQRKSNGDFRTIGFVDGHGTTTDVQNYSYTDLNPERALYRYRLKQIDFDGSIEFSEEIEVEFFNPSKFELFQNYPNPFNPSTQIRYSIANTEFVNLSIFNSLGEKVAELVNESKPAGKYTVSFDAGILSSGVYIARINAGNFNQIIKMSLLK